MKNAAATTPKKKGGMSRRTIKILKALRDARKQAVKTARLHGVPIIYEKDGKIVRERP